MSKKNYGDILAQEVSGRVAAPVATIAALKAVPAANRVDGQTVIVMADGSRWMFLAAGALAGDDQLVVAPTAGAGTWLRLLGAFDLALPITFATADAAVLLTIPTGAVLAVRRCYWEPTVAFTGGTSSAIGLSSSNAAYNTKGDLLGGASGDVLASLTVGRVKPGTTGAKTAAGIFLVGADTVRFDRITSVFTAGTGNAHLAGDLLANPGA